MDQRKTVAFDTRQSRLSLSGIAFVSKENIDWVDTKICALPPVLNVEHWLTIILKRMQGIWIQ